MNYLAVKDLKQTRMLRELLRKERELIVTKDGKPFALMIDVTPESLEVSLKEVRRAMFSSAASRARKKASRDPVKPDAIESQIRASRNKRPPE